MILSTVLLAASLAGHAAEPRVGAAEPQAGLRAADAEHAEALRRRRGTFVTLAPFRLRSLDPAVAYDQGSFSVIANIYEPLLAFDGAPDRFKPWLASAVPSLANGGISADRRTYRFHLRSGVRFHEGGELTAEDARYSMLREMLIETPGRPASLLLRPLLGADSALGPDGKWALEPEAVERAVRAEGGDLVFELRKPFPGFLAMIAARPVVTAKSWAVAQGDWDGRLPKPGDAPIQASEALRFHSDGTGAYRLTRSTGDGRELWLERFGGYWGRAPSFERVYVRAEPQGAMRAALLRDGEADYAYMDRADAAALRGEKNVRVEDDLPNFAPGETLFMTLALDAKDNPRLGSGKLDGAGIPADFFRDVRVREAFSLAFDARAYMREALGGKGTPAGGPIPRTLLHRRTARAYGYDPERAKALLREAYGGELWKKGFRLVAAYPRGLPRRQVAAEILKRGVEALNPAFKVEMEGMRYPELERQAWAHRLPVFVLSLAPDYPDAHAVAFEFFHSKGVFPRAQGIEDAELDRLEEEAAGEADPDVRTDKFARLQELAGRRAYQINTAYHPHVRAHCASLKGVRSGHCMCGLEFVNLLYWPSLSRE